MRSQVDRRKLLALGGAVVSMALCRPALAVVPRTPTSSLRFHNLHTGESLTSTYRVDGVYVPEALADIRKVLRDFRTGDEHDIDVGLLDLLSTLNSEA